MELLNNIWNTLSTPNECLINIILIPSTVVEAIFTLLIFTTILNLKASTIQKIIYVISCSIISFINTYFIPSPINIFVNYISIFVIIYLIFKISFFQGLLASIIPTIIFALVSSLIMNPYFTLFNISYNESATIPIYRIIYLLIMYAVVLIILLLLKFKKVKIKIFDFNIDTKSKNVLFLNLIIGFITLIIQAVVTLYYVDILPIFITFLSFLSLLAYFGVSIYSLTRVIKLAFTTQKLQNAEEYNKTLTILHDNVRGFKHDFDNIVTTIGGYVQ